MDRLRVRAKVIITGRVQGVGFRAWTAQEAQTRSLTGRVRNKKDGSVEAILEGEKDNVEKMLECFSRGPLLAAVNDVKIEFSEATEEFQNFTIVD